MGRDLGKGVSMECSDCHPDATKMMSRESFMVRSNQIDQSRSHLFLETSNPRNPGRGTSPARLARRPCPLNGGFLPGWQIIINKKGNCNPSPITHLPLLRPINRRTRNSKWGSQIHTELNKPPNFCSPPQSRPRPIPLPSLFFL